MRAILIAALLLGGGCKSTSPTPEATLRTAPGSTSPAPQDEVRPHLIPWAPATRSPWPASLAEARETTLASSCGTPDGALARVAAVLATDRAHGHGAPDPERVVSLLRANGEPHVRPRVISASGRGPLDDESLRDQLEAVRRAGVRCGLAFAHTDDGKELLVAIAVDALADLEPFPVRARTGQWLTMSASLHVPATGAKVIVLGPRGLPRTVPTSIDRATGMVRARFALDRPGAFTVQLVGDLAGGPQPLLEARVFADVEPPAPDEPPGSAPGEEAGGTGDEAALARMTAALRTSESLPPLRRNEQLDALARAHAEKMHEARAIAHDVGEGDLAMRFEGAGLFARVVGENVARARSLALAYRALHASPSHRLNLLRAEYTHVGLSVVTDEDGTVYVCQVFAGGMR